MAKYKAGDKVRIRPDLKRGEMCAVFATSEMEEMAGKIVEIKRLTTEDFRGYPVYHVKEDKREFNWTEDMFVPVEGELKSGDKVKVRPDLKPYESKPYDDCGVTVGMAKFAGEFVTIKEVMDLNRYTIVESGNDLYWSSEMFVLDKAEAEKDSSVQEIVITSNGKKTTATYRNNGKTVIAISRCSPDDTFDFAEGAKIAFARLWDGEEEDEPEQQGYNGKIVCIQRGYNNISDPLLGLTVGKVYTVTDGRFTFDDGHTSACKYFTLEALCIGTGHKFIPLVE